MSNAWKTFVSLVLSRPFQNMFCFRNKTLKTWKIRKSMKIPDLQMIFPYLPIFFNANKSGISVAGLGLRCAVAAACLLHGTSPQQRPPSGDHFGRFILRKNVGKHNKKPSPSGNCTWVYLALPHHRICLLSLLEMPRLGESHGYKGPAQDNLGTMVK